ncbi:MAG: hypothetical protein Q4G62_07155 [Pseudomonadota bacterium]|nr:hypothetical protein [Pseudomonadota bacterium]
MNKSTKNSKPSLETLRTVDVALRAHRALLEHHRGTAHEGVCTAAIEHLEHARNALWDADAKHHMTLAKRLAPKLLGFVDPLRATGYKLKGF